jgi:hypothetical protein
MDRVMTDRIEQTRRDAGWRKRIAVVQGARSGDVQRLFRQFVERWRGDCRIAGVIEQGEDAEDCAGKAARLVNIREGASHALFQNLGSGAAACALDSPGLVAVGEAIRQDILAGCDIAIISKFGKLEAESRSGLIAAFSAAVEGEVPVLTAVSPRFDEAWSRFAAPLFERLPADPDAIDQWWRDVRRGA